MLNRKPLKVIYYTDRAGETRYRIRAANGHTLVPPESHAKSAAVRAFRRLVEELTAGNYVEIDDTDEERRRRKSGRARGKTTAQ